MACQDWNPRPKMRSRLADQAAYTVRRLVPGDEETLMRVTAVDYRFEHDPATTTTSPPLDLEAARAFLADPTVLYWMAEHDGRPIGMLHCYLLRLPHAGGPNEILLHDLGTDIDWRRRGVARTLVEAMEAFMASEGIEEVWLGAVATAVDFYLACGFVVSGEKFMEKSIDS